MHEEENCFFFSFPFWLVEQVFPFPLFPPRRRKIEDFFFFFRRTESKVLAFFFFPPQKNVGEGLIVFFIPNSQFCFFFGCMQMLPDGLSFASFFYFSLFSRRLLVSVVPFSLLSWCHPFSRTRSSHYA